MPAPYDSTDIVLNFARVIANDAQISLDGNLLSDTQPYTFQMLSLAWRKLQDRLGNNSIESFPSEVILSNISPIDKTLWTEPAAKVFINYDGYNDGVTMWTSPVLPQDLQIPLKLWERPSGQNAQFVPMHPSNSGLPSRPKINWLREWEWLNDQINMIGSTVVMDIRLRYKKFFIDPAGPRDVIPILRCATALAYYVVEIFSVPRGGTVTQDFLREREDAVKQIINNTTRKKQYGNFRRRPYSRRGSTKLIW